MFLNATVNMAFLIFGNMYNFPTWFFVAWVCLTRFGYNVGLGTLLYLQSKSERITKWMEDLPADSKLRAFIYSSVKKSLGPSVDVDKLPTPFMAWMVFRVAVDLVLVPDVIAVVALGISQWQPIVGFMDIFWIVLGFAIM